MKYLQLFTAVLLLVGVNIAASSSYQGDTICKKPDEWPRFPGEKDAVDKFLASNLKYPYDDKMNGTEGYIKVLFVVETDGSLSNLELLKNKRTYGSTEMEAEALRVVALMPKWIPGTKDGEPVRVQTELPIRFALFNGSKKKKK